MFLIVILHCWVVNNKVFQTEVFQNQIKDLAIQLPLHLLRTEYLNSLFASEPKDLSTLYCTFFSFHQFDIKLISWTLLPTSLKKIKVNLWQQARWLLGSRVTTWQNKTRTPVQDLCSFIWVETKKEKKVMWNHTERNTKIFLHYWASRPKI